jgi:ubiquinol-cytochrome c reductase cytochrome b subunit
VTPLFAWLFRTLDERLRLRKPAREVASHIFPHHWSFLFGEVALFSFVLLVLTGLFLTMFYRPSIDPVVYSGAYELYRGRELPEAYASILRLSHDVPGGLLFRRMHLGAAYLFVGAAVAHLLRVLLTGAFRRPREVNYHLGTLLLVIAFAAAYTGQNLRYDVMAGTSLRIGYAFLETFPFIGWRLAYWVFGGPFPGTLAVPRFFVLHILVFPSLIAAIVVVHLLIVGRQGHTQFAHPRVDGQRYIVGKPLWPYQFALSTSLVLVIGGTLTAFAVLVPWSDVDLHGPYRPGQASNASQPDYWLFWVEGALRLWPPIEWDLPGVTIHGVFLSGVVLPLLIIGALVAYPFIDRRFSAVAGDCNVLQRPLEVPGRAAVVFGAVTFLTVLQIAAGLDIIARVLQVPVEWVIWTLRIAALAGPAGAAWAAYLVARGHERRVAWERGE